LRAINQSHKNICYRNNWPFLEKLLTLTFDGVNATPSNAATDLRAVKKIMDTTTGKRIHFRRTDDFEEKHASQITLAGTPKLYYFVGNTLNFWPVPPSTQTLRQRYIQMVPNVGASDAESAFLLPADYHEAIVFRALMRLYDLDDDSALSARFEAHYENVLAQMEDALMAKQHDEPEYVHVVDPDDFDDEYWPI
jgi:hypothetical protein